MWRFVRSKASPSMVVALLALFVAMGGSAVAVSLPGQNSVNSGDVRNNSIRGVDIRDGSVTGADLSLGFNVQSYPGVIPRTLVRMTCRHGAAVSGGVDVGDPGNEFIATSRPSTVVSPGTGWDIQVGQVGPPDPAPSTAYVVCVGLGL